MAAGFLPTPLTVPYAYGVHTIALKFGLGWMALILMLVGGLGYLIVWLRWGRLGVYPFSLRVAAGTVVGLIAIPGLSDNVAQFLFAPMAQTGGAAWTGIALLTAALIAAFLYLFSGALGRLNDWGMALRRAAHLFFFGWAQALVFCERVAAGRGRHPHAADTGGAAVARPRSGDRPALSWFCGGGRHCQLCHRRVYADLVGAAWP
ncbi:MAG: hypothetical protein R2856_23345 [Caldilineaceae bacterium]